jgi:nitrogen fixation protein FixH
MYPEDDSSNHTLDFLEVSENTYTITDTLTPGMYVLSIYVYDSHGNTIAGSDITYVIVK